MHMRTMLVVLLVSLSVGTAWLVRDFQAQLDMSEYTVHVRGVIDECLSEVRSRLVHDEDSDRWFCRLVDELCRRLPPPRK